MAQVYLKEPYISPVGNYYTAGYYEEETLPPALFKQKPDLVLRKQEKVLEKTEKEYTDVDKLPEIKTVVKTPPKKEPVAVNPVEKPYPLQTKARAKATPRPDIDLHEPFSVTQETPTENV